MSRINKILLQVNEEIVGTTNFTDSRFQEIKGYLDSIQKTILEIPSKLNSTDTHDKIIIKGLEDRLNHAMYEIEYLQSDFLKLKKK